MGERVGRQAGKVAKGAEGPPREADKFDLVKRLQVKLLVDTRQYSSSGTQLGPHLPQVGKARECNFIHLRTKLVREDLRGNRGGNERQQERLHGEGRASGKDHHQGYLSSEKQGREEREIERAHQIWQQGFSLLDCIESRECNTLEQQVKVDQEQEAAAQRPAR